MVGFFELKHCMSLGAFLRVAQQHDDVVGSQYDFHMNIHFLWVLKDLPLFLWEKEGDK